MKALQWLSGFCGLLLSLVAMVDCFLKVGADARTSLQSSELPQLLGTFGIDESCISSVLSQNVKQRLARITVEHVIQSVLKTFLTFWALSSLKLMLSGLWQALCWECRHEHSLLFDCVLESVSTCLWTSEVFLFVWLVLCKIKEGGLRYSLR